jgi:hypothetical protein
MAAEPPLDDDLSVDRDHDGLQRLEPGGPVEDRFQCRKITGDGGAGGREGEDETGENAKNGRHGHMLAAAKRVGQTGRARSGITKI